ncbi:MAG: hypothetical protein U5J96_07395 [Ignavibacteriaceae bacterium]|nr:hypothetical protein [Ignavibacteriaceae bacterium]
MILEGKLTELKTNVPVYVFGIAGATNVSVNIKFPPAGIVTVSGTMFQLGPAEIFASTSNGVILLLVTVIGKLVVEPVMTLIRFTTFRLGSIASIPFPCNEYIVGDPDALCVNSKLPVISPVDVGANVTSINWFPPAAIVSGNVFGVNVNCPSDDVMFVITRSDVPVLLTVACRTEFDPTTTFPKFRLIGAIPNPAATPVPCNEYIVGDPDALCVNPPPPSKLPVISPVDVGANVTSINWFPPGCYCIRECVWCKCKLSV